MKSPCAEARPLPPNRPNTCFIPERMDFRARATHHPSLWATSIIRARVRPSVLLGTTSWDAAGRDTARGVQISSPRLILSEVSADASDIARLALLDRIDVSKIPTARDHQLALMGNLISARLDFDARCARRRASRNVFEISDWPTREGDTSVRRYFARRLKCPFMNIERS